MENNQSWDCALKIFLNDMGLVQALRGFELDMLVLNPGWERETVPSALERFIENIKVCFLTKFTRCIDVHAASTRPSARYTG